jgi:hypothetical protein
MKKALQIILIGLLAYVAIGLFICKPEARVVTQRISERVGKVDLGFSCQMQGDYWLEVYMLASKMTPERMKQWNSIGVKERIVGKIHEQTGFVLDDIGIGHFGSPYSVPWDSKNEYDGIMLGTLKIESGDFKMALDKNIFNSLGPVDWIVIQYDRESAFHAKWKYCVRSLFWPFGRLCCDFKK